MLVRTRDLMVGTTRFGALDPRFAASVLALCVPQLHKGFLCAAMAVANRDIGSKPAILRRDQSPLARDPQGIITASAYFAAGPRGIQVDIL